MIGGGVLLFLGSVLFSPVSSPASSFVFSLASSTSSGVGSRSTSTNRWLSGDQAKSSTSCTVSVIFCASPPCRLRRYTCFLPSFRPDKKARYFPSGLQRG